MKGEKIKGDTKEAADKNNMVFLFSLFYFQEHFSELETSLHNNTLRKSHCGDKIYEEFYPNMVVNYQIWPAVQFCNFYFFPAHLRVLVVNVVSLFWNTYLAWTSHKELEHSKQ